MHDGDPSQAHSNKSHFKDFFFSSRYLLQASSYANTGDACQLQLHFVHSIEVYDDCTIMFEGDEFDDFLGQAPVLSVVVLVTDCQDIQ